MKASINSNGMQEVFYEGINAGEKDYNAVITKLKEAKADVLYFGGYHPEAGLYPAAGRRTGREAADDHAGLHRLGGVLASGGTGGEGTLFVFPSDPQSRPEAKEAVAKISAGGFKPDGFTLFSYAVIEAFAAGIEKAGTDDPTKVAEVLKNGEAIQTVVGPVNLRRQGRPEGRPLRHQPLEQRRLRRHSAVNRPDHSERGRRACRPSQFCWTCTTSPVTRQDGPERTMSDDNDRQAGRPIGESERREAARLLGIGFPTSRSVVPLALRWGWASRRC